MTELKINIYTDLDSGALAEVLKECCVPELVSVTFSQMNEAGEWFPEGILSVVLTDKEENAAEYAALGNNAVRTVFVGASGLERGIYGRREKHPRA